MTKNVVVNRSWTIPVQNGNFVTVGETTERDSVEIVTNEFDAIGQKHVKAIVRLSPAQWHELCGVEYKVEFAAEPEEAA
jgi:hypothetical protein